VIGGGPAGVATALTLRQLAPAWTVVLAHRPITTRWRPGETLAPGCRPVLESLAMWDAFLADGHPEALGTRAAWGSDVAYDNEFLFSTRGPGWHLDRPRFDAMLLDAARSSGIEIVSERPAHARFNVDATGRAASYAVSRGARRIAADNLIGIGRIVEGPPAVPYTLIEAHETGWQYTAPLPQNRAVIAWMTDPDLRPLTAERATTFSARSQHLTPCAGPGWLAVGDAAAAFDPLSSQGILRALRMGKIAAFTIYDTLRGNSAALDKYRAYVASEYAHYRASHAEFYRRETRWPDAPFWARRHNPNGIARHA
jgi:flavin-dependent dehydrogenase